MSPQSSGKIPSRDRWAKIRLFAMDVDGVLTDGRVLVFSNGVEAKEFSILDGMGLRRVIDAGIDVAWISGRSSEATEIRGKELRIPHVFQGNRNKLEVLREITGASGIPAEGVCYMGDDVIDLECLEWAGIAVAPPGAQSGALAAADFATAARAGDGAVREVCNYLLDSRRV